MSRPPDLLPLALTKRRLSCWHVRRCQSSDTGLYRWRLKSLRPTFLYTKSAFIDSSVFGFLGLGGSLFSVPTIFRFRGHLVPLFFSRGTVYCGKSGQYICLKRLISCRHLPLTWIASLLNAIKCRFSSCFTRDSTTYAIPAQKTCSNRSMRAQSSDRPWHLCTVTANPRISGNSDVVGFNCNHCTHCSVYEASADVNVSTQHDPCPNSHLQYCLQASCQVTVTVEFFQGFLCFFTPLECALGLVDLIDTRNLFRFGI